MEIDYILDSDKIGEQVISNLMKSFDEPRKLQLSYTPIYGDLEKAKENHKFDMINQIIHGVPAKINLGDETGFTMAGFRWNRGNYPTKEYKFRIIRGELWFDTDIEPGYIVSRFGFEVLNHSIK